MHVTVRHRSVFCACSTKCLTWTVTFAFIAKTYFFSNFTPPAVIKRVEMKSWIGHAKVRLANVAKIGFLHLHWCFWCLKFEYILIYLTPSACFNAESTFDDQFVNWHTKKCQLHILSCFQKVDPFKWIDNQMKTATSVPSLRWHFYINTKLLFTANYGCQNPFEHFGALLDIYQGYKSIIHWEDTSNIFMCTNSAWG